MGHVKDKLIDTTIEVMERVGMPDTETNFDEVSEWIMENVIYPDLHLTATIADDLTKVLCPHCMSLSGCSCESEARS